MIRYAVPSTPLLDAVVLTSVLWSCGGDQSRSPACGLALAAGPTLVYQHLTSQRSLMTTVPRGLPDTLPARVRGQQAAFRVLVSYDAGELALGFEGTNFPPRPGYAVLVVDDTSQRAMGVIVYEWEPPPADYPRLGTVSSGETSVPLYAVRLDWASISNPRCPLLGPPDTT